MRAKVFNIPSSVPFGETLARGLIDRLGARDKPLALADAVIYLPSRRATRALADIFAKQLGAALLPEMRPLGDVNEEEFLFEPESDALDLPAAIDPIRRLLLLATLVQRWHKDTREAPIGFAQAAGMAKGLAKFLDDAETQGADLSKLEELAPENFAGHWAGVLQFLCVARDQWPVLLRSEKKEDPATRRNLSLTRLCEKLEANPPPKPVIAAGSTGSIPATARLLGAIARLPNGMVVLPGLDREMDAESWNALDADPGHPQYGLKQLLAAIGVRREDVEDWPVAAQRNVSREKLLREALRPPPTTDAWLALAGRESEELAKGLEGLVLIETAHPREEAASIALVLREALEKPKQTAALVTPDRNLARRVAAEMRRWDIAIDDSAGRPLAHTPPGAFLCLLAEAADAEFAPVPLLALLKHPLCAGGMDVAEFRRMARALDRLCLRGPRPDPGARGIARAIAAARHDLRKDQDHERTTIDALKPWFANLVRILQPLENLRAQRSVALKDLLKTHIAAAENLAATDGEDGGSRLWSGPAGDAASRLVASLDGAAEDLPSIEPAAYAPLFRELALDKAVRPAFGQHPRLSILGTLEARLLNFDVVVLGGLNETTWPSAATTDPWLSRPMRKTIGLEPPERDIGRAAHDFATLAAGPKVFLSRALKVEGTPTVASRWLQRLEQLTNGLGLTEKFARNRQYAAIAHQLETPGAVKPNTRPRPTPPVDIRPRKLSVTEIETWLRDPYEIYAKHILRLKPLDPLDAPVGPLERGNAVHEALEKFMAEFPDALTPAALPRLVAIADEVFAKQEIPHAVLALWRPRFVRAARWFVAQERLRRAGITRSHTEIRGEYSFGAAAGDFTLFGYADRIDELHAGGAAILDYKTGILSTVKQVKSLLAPQLPLEGLILKEGKFGDIGKLDPAELLYIRFSGGREPGEIVDIEGDVPALVSEAKARLIARVEDFDRKEKPYDAQVMPVETRRPSVYAHLERIREWSAGDWENEE